MHFELEEAVVGLSDDGSPWALACRRLLPYAKAMEERFSGHLPPPLTRDDIIPIVGIFLGGRYLVSSLPPEGRVTVRTVTFLCILCARAVVEVNPQLAIEM